MLGHSTIVITGNTYTSVLPEAARPVVESAAAIVPRNRRSNTDPAVNGSAPISHPSGWTAISAGPGCWSQGGGRVDVAGEFAVGGDDAGLPGPLLPLVQILRHRS